MRFAGRIGEDERLKGRSRRKEGPTVSMRDGALEIAFRARRRIRQREDHGRFIPFAHLAKQRWCEHPAQR